MQLVSFFRSSCSAQLSGETSRSRTEAGAEAPKGGFDVPERVCALRDRVELPITTEWVGCVRKVKSGGIEAAIPPGKVLGTYQGYSYRADPARAGNCQLACKCTHMWTPNATCAPIAVC